VLVTAYPRDSYAETELDRAELTRVLGGKPPVEAGVIPVAVRGRFSAPRRLEGHRYNALVLVSPDPLAGELARDIELRPAKTLAGRVIGPDGESLEGAIAFGLTVTPGAKKLSGADFLAEGLSPGRPRAVSFYHRGRGLGKVLTVRGDEVRSLTVRLEPCGQVIGRLLDKAGHPVAGVDIAFIAPGPTTYTRTDRDGRFRTDLVPGLKYRVRLSAASQVAIKHPLEFEAASGLTRDLGDLPLSN
jgi:hypothetical protein